LIDLVQASHRNGIRVILDVVFITPGIIGLYRDGENLPLYQPYPQQLSFGKWRGPDGDPSVTSPAGLDDAVWPLELQDGNAYMRAGIGNLGSSGNEDPNDGTLEFRRSDFPPDGLRKFNHYSGLTLSDLNFAINIGLVKTATGFRIDTVKHVTGRYRASVYWRYKGIRSEYWQR